ncbi:MAG TPA: ABC transporter permease, partial [Bacteroidales bacterium]|nr:ABC transporter permease [Bacteroidales bacterium]
MNPIGPGTLKNFLRTSWRYLTRHKVFTLINVACLTIGLACSFLVLIWVDYELSYDRFHKDADRIYRIISDVPFGEELLKAAITPSLLGEAVDHDLKEVELSVRLRKLTKPVLRYRSDAFAEAEVYLSDPGFFEIFTFGLVQGDPHTCLLHSNSIVISQELAERHFNGADPMGRMIEVNNRYHCQVTGVFRTPDQPSHLSPDALLPMALLYKPEQDKMNPWRRYSLYTYVKLREGVDPDQVEQGITRVFRAHDPEYVPGTDDRMQFELQPLKRIHLEPGLHADSWGQGDRSQIIIFLVVAIVILLIAMINFVNHTTARARLRYKEIAVRKAFGASRGSLILQFLGESVILSLVSLLLAISLMEFMVTMFNRFMMEGLSFYLERDVRFLGIFFLISLVAGVLAGIYPALSLSAIEPIRILRVEPAVLKRRTLVRRSLIILQFAVSIAILACTLIVSRQVSYIRDKSPGFNPYDLLVFNMNEEILKALPEFRDELLQVPGVRHTGATSILPMLGTAYSSDVRWDEQPEGEEFRVHFRYVDEGFLSTLGIPVVRGKDFAPRPGPADTLTMIVNESFAASVKGREVLGLPLTFAQYRHGRVIGVVKDFHISSLHEPIGPIMLMLGREELQYLLVRVDPAQVSSIYPELERLWKTYAPHYPFEYTYLSDRYQGLYEEEARTYSLLLYFTVLALLISFLGLFGLASFRAEQRRKEIGVRKVYGASPASITLGYLKEVGAWILFAGVLALPVAWMVMDRWLDRFAYATIISPFVLAVSLLIA